MEQHTVAQCRDMIEQATTLQLPSVLASLADDPRKGVQDAVRAGQRRLEAHRAERHRLAALALVESDLRAQGFSAVAGVDEVGRGALAGPLTIGAVILPSDARIEGLDDSKRLTPERREALDPIIRSMAVSHSVIHITAEEIDSIGISSATRRAVTLALDALDPRADHVIVDGLGVGGLGIPETAIVGGDGRCAAVAAASVIAKVTRDALMRSFDPQFPHYGFAVNKGYGTGDHLAAITRHGLCELHRRSFSPCGGTLPLF